MIALRGLALATGAWFAAASIALATPSARFDDALRLDLAGTPDLAYRAFLQAAETGLPEAEFNVAVMLDSGRGVPADWRQAATWYARAASHGHARAAFNLGQLYESGQGVPRNLDLANAWFKAAKIPAARARVTAEPRTVVAARSEPAAPVPVAPRAGTIDAAADGLELVWTSEQQKRPARYYVEMICVGRNGTSRRYAATTDVSSLFVALTDKDEVCTWRVSVFFAAAKLYATSEWSDVERE